MHTEKGSLSINSENIFPIIKKWLYSDHDIFIRELISNGCDAITKYRKLGVMKETTIADDTTFRVDVQLDPENKTLTFTDNGIGMTDEEVKKYINQIAFSGAEDFLSHYKDKTDDDQIIGHFGLGFYSAFMVSDKVEIHSLSYKENAEAIHWSCDGGTEFELERSDKTTRGTKIILHINEDGKDFLSAWKVKETIEKYCSFMPYEIYFEDVTEKPEEDEDGNIIVNEPKAINDTHPLYLRNPKDCTDEEYKDFYKKTFMDFKDPLFWIHLKMDYPFNLNGILYFPKLNNEFDTLEGQIKLFNNQVFIADNVSEVIPEFLLLLKGVIDCPDLPLNVSRSFLQNDGQVKKISNYITKKVADKLNGLFKTEREVYESYWDDINPFIKYGCLKEDKFYDKVKDSLIYKTTEDQFVTINEYTEKYPDAKEVIPYPGEGAGDDTVLKVIYYSNDELQQAQYIKMFKDMNMEAVLLEHPIDNAFISTVEMKVEGIKFKRIDSDLTDLLKDNDSTADLEDLQTSLDPIFKSMLENENLKIKVESLKDDSVSAIMTLSEESRRMQEMAKAYNMYGMNSDMFKPDQTLILNANHGMIKFVADHKDDDSKKEDIKLFCQQIYDLAMLSHQPLTPIEMTNFIARSNEIMKKLAE